MSKPKDCESAVSQGKMSVEELSSFDAVLYTVCDVHGVARGRFAVGRSVQTLATEGLRVPGTICVRDLRSKFPSTLSTTDRSATSLMVPDLSTLRPLSWLSNKEKKVGHVLCNLSDQLGNTDMTSPRDLALKQLSRLKDMGYQILTSTEAEYMMYHRGTMDPIFKPGIIVNLQKMDGKVEFLYDHMLALLASGIPVETQMLEMGPGQIEYSMQPQFGIEMPDAVHRLRYVTKSLCQTYGVDVSFMTRPSPEHCSNGFHFNHSLWTLDGRNAFYDPEDKHKCSDLLRQWLAGLIHHGPALTALLSPTANCYRRFHELFTPTDNTWNYDDRNARIRVKTKNKNIYIEERTPSSASNPYLVMAALLAAGMDGIANNMDCPPNREFKPLLKEDERAKVLNPLPHTLEESLQALDNSAVLRDTLGDLFVDSFLALGREGQLGVLGKLQDEEGDSEEGKKEREEERYAMMRDLCFATL